MAGGGARQEQVPPVGTAIGCFPAGPSPAVLEVSVSGSGWPHDWVVGSQIPGASCNAGQMPSWEWVGMRRGRAGVLWLGGRGDLGRLASRTGYLRSGEHLPRSSLTLARLLRTFTGRLKLLKCGQYLVFHGTRLLETDYLSGQRAQRIKDPTQSSERRGYARGRPS